MASCFYFMTIISFQNFFLLSLLPPISTFLFVLTSACWRFLQRSSDFCVCIFQCEAVRGILEGLYSSILRKRAVDCWASFRGSDRQPGTHHGAGRASPKLIIRRSFLGPFISLEKSVLVSCLGWGMPSGLILGDK